MFIYNVFVNEELKEEIIPCCQGIMEMHEFMMDKMKELGRKYDSQNNKIKVKREWVNR